MFKEYHICLSNGVTDHTLVYDLESHRPAQVWAEIMNGLNVSSLRPNFNPWHGIGEQVNILIERLVSLAKLLNLPVNLPENIQDIDLQELLNRLHIHFPELEKTETNIQIREWLTEYNDIIHKLEDIERNTTNFIWLCVLPDKADEIDLADNDYSLFSASKNFGDLCLHYPHVGRHLLEILKSKDFDCPLDQVVTQTKITAFHTLRFYDDLYSEDEYKTFLQMLLQNSPLGEVYNITDPKIAFGYINIGKLRYSTQAEIVNILKDTHFIKSWKIVS